MIDTNNLNLISVKSIFYAVLNFVWRLNLIVIMQWLLTVFFFDQPPTWRLMTYLKAWWTENLKKVVDSGWMRLPKIRIVGGSSSLRSAVAHDRLIY